MASTVDRSKLPATGAPPSLKLPSPSRAKLSNGLKVVVVERHSAPVVDFTLIADAGFAADSIGQARHCASCRCSCCRRARRPANSLADRRARRVAWCAACGVGSSLDRSYLSMNALSGRLRGIARSVCRCPAESDLPVQRNSNVCVARLWRPSSRRRRSRRASINRVLPEASLRRRSRLLESRFGHRYGGGGQEPHQRRAGSVLQALGASRQFSVASRRRHHARSRFSPCSNRALARGERQPKRCRPRIWRDVALASRPRVFLIDRPGAEQSQIVAATVAPSRADPDYIRFVALDTLLGGNFSSRLNMNLREDKHWSYGARHAPYRGDRPGDLSVPVRAFRPTRPPSR